MSMALVNEKGVSFRFSLVGWSKVLNLANMYGWKPAGTIIDFDVHLPQNPTPEEKAKSEARLREWDGTYFTNDQQLVTKEDALAIAAALEQSLGDIPENDEDIPDQNIYSSTIQTTSPYPFENQIDGILQAVKNELGDFPHNAPNRNLHPFEYFGGHNKQGVIYFIAFCKEGAFRIG